MRRLGLVGAMAAPLLVVVLGSAGASAAVVRPGPPTAVQATYVDGVSGVTVSWGAPVSDGGSPIVYYVASNYSGKYSCVSLNPGPASCHIDGLHVGKVVRAIRVRAVSARGAGRVAVVLPVLTTGNNGGTSASGPSGTSQPAAGQTPSPVPGVSNSTSDTGAASAASSATAGAGVPAALPFTGADVGALFILGATLVLGGWVMGDPAGRPGYRTESRPSRASRWLFGL